MPAHLVIVGGGLAAARAIASYRDAGGDARITLVAREPHLPYHRPPLSKRFLRGEADGPALVQDADFYRRSEVEVLLGAAADAIRPDRRTVELDSGMPLRYDTVLVATGARPRTLDVPGATLAGVHALRTVDDAATIRDAARAAGRAVVVGAGFIGMEAAASLRALGVEVTLVHRERTLFESLGSPAVGEQLADLYRTRGVELALGEEVEGFAGDRRLRAVVTRSGRRLEADLAVVGVGVVPNVEAAAAGAIGLGDGIRVDERFATDAPGVHAVGDVAEIYDARAGRRRRVEHWSNANHQGAAVGRVLAGGDAGATPVPSFFTELFGVTLKLVGDPAPGGDQLVGGSLEGGDLVVLYGADGRLTGVLTAGASDELGALLTDLVREHAPLARAAAAAGERPFSGARA